MTRNIIYLDIKPLVLVPLDQKPKPQGQKSGKWQQSISTGILVIWVKS